MFRRLLMVWFVLAILVGTGTLGYVLWFCMGSIVSVTGPIIGQAIPACLWSGLAGLAVIFFYEFSRSRPKRHAMVLRETQIWKGPGRIPIGWPIVLR